MNAVTGVQDSARFEPGMKASSLLLMELQSYVAADVFNMAEDMDMSALQA